MSTKFSVTKNRKVVDPSLYTWDETTKTFSTKEDGLVLDFTGINNVVFKTGDNCTFKTGDNCTFTTGESCTFNTRDECVFNTMAYCVFKTGMDCTFLTGDNCTFTTGNHCRFTTLYECVFNTGYGCIFKTKGKSSLTYTWCNCYEVHKLNNADVEYTIHGDGSLTIKEPETENERKIQELKETIKKLNNKLKSFKIENNH